MKTFPKNKLAETDSYLERIRTFPLRRLKGSHDLAAAKRQVLKLMGDDLDRGGTEYRDVLVDLIADYERRAGLTVDTSGLSASELVRHRLAERGFSISDLARSTGIQQSNLSEMLSGKRAWSKNAIRTISAELAIRADRFF